VPKLIDSSTVALTPDDSIATPTFSSANLQVTTKAVPASSPKPTLAPVTSPSKHQVSSKTDSPNQSPGSADKPSPSQASHSAEQPESAGNAQSQADGRLDSGRLSSALDSDRSLMPTKETLIPSSQATRPAEPNAGSSANEGSLTGMNALSVLSEAQSSAEAADRVTLTPSNPTHDGVPTRNLVSATSAPQSFTIALADGGSATVRVAESSLVIAQNGLSAVAAPGREVTIGAHVFSAAAQGTAIIVDNIATHTVPSPSDSTAALVFTADGRVLSAKHQGDKLLIFDGTHLLTAEAGEAFMVGSQTISINSGASELVVGTTTRGIPIKADAASIALTTFMANGQELVASAAANGESIVVQQGSSNTITLTAGEQAVIGGETMSVAQNGGALVLIDAGETVSLAVPASASGGSGPRKTSSTTATDFGGHVEESAGKTATDDGGGGEVSSTPEVEGLSGGGIRLGCTGPLGGLSLCVCIVAVVALL
jgi:hypothetical protein